MKATINLGLGDSVVDVGVSMVDVGVSMVDVSVAVLSVVSVDIVDVKREDASWECFVTKN